MNKKQTFASQLLIFLMLFFIVGAHSEKNEESKLNQNFFVVSARVIGFNLSTFKIEMLHLPRLGVLAEQEGAMTIGGELSFKVRINTKEDGLLEADVYASLKNKKSNNDNKEINLKHKFLMKPKEEKPYCELITENGEKILYIITLKIDSYDDLNTFPKMEMIWN